MNCHLTGMTGLSIVVANACDVIDYYDDGAVYYRYFTVLDVRSACGLMDGTKVGRMRKLQQARFVNSRTLL